ncbi:MAG: multiple sugar transport system permease protein [Solirubrobacteraceae bacterium]|jgi:multiple sugar transport system permease protein|nr:multiple sugar transport system permease protein [Solirubrobacteraceae bacterium]
MAVGFSDTDLGRGRRRSWRRRAPLTRHRRREALAGWAFLAPSALGTGLFVLVPMLLAFALSFTSANGFGQYPWVGLANYERLFHDPLFINSIKVTLLFVVGFVPGVYLLGLVMALIVHGTIPLRAFFRVAFFAPYTISLVVVGLVWRYMLADRVGVVGSVLDQIGIDAPSFLGSPSFALWVVVAASVWFFVGYYMVILLGGLQEIPQDVIDAARLDGAGTWRMVTSIVLPMLRPTTFFALVLATISGLAGLQSFDLIYVMTQGGPANATSLGIYYVYEQAFKSSQFGYAAAMATWYALVLILLTGLAFKLTKGGRFDAADL